MKEDGFVTIKTQLHEKEDNGKYSYLEGDAEKHLLSLSPFLLRALTLYFVPYIGTYIGGTFHGLFACLLLQVPHVY